MLAGEPLFSGPTAQDVIAKHITESATSVLTRRSTVPANVDQALERVLAKAPADRFTTGARFAEALAAPAASTERHPTPEPSLVSGAPDKSIAVLPFANMSADPENEYFSDGITEEIINALAHLPGLHVAAPGRRRSRSKARTSISASWARSSTWSRCSREACAKPGIVSASPHN
jgi:serine/threonine-protein kinase